MKRFLTTVILLVLIVICFLFQTTVFKWLALANVVPNLLIILTVSVGYMRGRTDALFTGLLCGLAIDCMYGDVMGLTALIYMVTGYISGYANLIYVTDDYTMPIFVIGIGDLIYSILFYVFNFLLRARLNFLYYLRHIILPELVYTVVVALVLYKLFHMINEQLERFERKEA